MGYLFDNLIEFVLMYSQEIAEAVQEQRLDVPHGYTGGNNGHSRVSDPTALKAIRNVAEIASVKIEYGAEFYGERQKKIVKNPERWLKVAQAVAKHHGKSETSKMFYDCRYVRRLDWQNTCKELNISKNIYYAMRADVVDTAKLYAIHYGICEPKDFLKV